MSASLNVKRRSIAGNTAQKPSQYRQALQMAISRWPSSINFNGGFRPPNSAERGTSGLPSGDAAKHGPNRHAETGEVAFSDNVAGHDLAGSENVGVRTQSLDFRALVHFHAEVRKRNSWT